VVSMIDRPMVDPLESRQLLAADLVASATYKATVLVMPGSKGSVTVNIQNTGDTLTRATIPVSLYYSKSSTYSAETATLLASKDVKNATIKTGQKKNQAIAFTLPSNLPSGQIYLFANVDPNQTGQETTFANNVALAGTTFNPIGAFSGTSTFAQVEPSRLNLNLVLSGKKITSNVFFEEVANTGEMLTVTSAKTSFSSAGKLSINNTGTIVVSGLGNAKYTLTMSGTLASDSSHTLSGKVKIVVKGGRNNATFDGTFSVVPAVVA
jgi:hypothetical protein